MTRHSGYTSQRSGHRQRACVARRATAAACLLILCTGPLCAQSSDALTVRVKGTILLNGFRNSARVNNTDVPTIVLPPDTLDLPAENLGATVRQTRVRLLINAPQVAGAVLDGELDVDFHGGQQPSSGGRTHPLVRIRRAFAELRWARGTMLVGQEAPPLVEPNPSTLASIGFPGFAAAGNLWLWLPQVRGTLFLNPGAPVRAALQAAVLAPSAGEAQDPFLTQPDRAERSGRPSLEGRALLRWGEGDQLAEIGVGAHVGWLATTAATLVKSHAWAASALVPLGRHLEIRGEAFTGQALAGLGGGGIGQNFATPGEPLETNGGWFQVAVRPAPEWELGGGWGMDDPENAGLAPGARTRNSTAEGHLIWRPDILRLGIEVRRSETKYAGPVGSRANTHLNLALGLDF